MIYESSIEDFFNIIKNKRSGDKIKKYSTAFKLNVKHLVYLFKGIECPDCGCKGDKFIYNNKNKSIKLMTKEGIYMSVDHIIPVSRKGMSHIKNYMPMCEVCNSKKGKNIDNVIYRHFYHYGEFIDRSWKVFNKKYNGEIEINNVKYRKIIRKLVNNPKLLLTKVDVEYILEILNFRYGVNIHENSLRARKFPIAYIGKHKINVTNIYKVDKYAM